MVTGKYRAKPTMVGDTRFASKKEAARYEQLLLLERAGRIRQIQLQPRFPLKVNGSLICTYVGDFLYSEENARVIEDVKGFKTREYKFKRKLLLALNPGIDHREV